MRPRTTPADPAERARDRRREDRAPTAFSMAVAMLKAGLTWSALSALLGVPESTARGWTDVPPRRAGKAVQQARARLLELGLLDQEKDMTKNTTVNITDGRTSIQAPTTWRSIVVQGRTATSAWSVCLTDPIGAVQASWKYPTREEAHAADRVLERALTRGVDAVIPTGRK